MTRQNGDCAQAAADVSEALRVNEPERVSPASRSHIAGCGHCRAHMLALVQNMAPVAQPGLDCAAVTARMAAYIDLERADAAAAAREEPGIWWHLWSCASCLELYDLVHALAAAQEQGQLPPLDPSSASR